MTRVWGAEINETQQKLLKLWKC